MDGRPPFHRNDRSGGSHSLAVAALRDFFFARDGRQMAEALDCLVRDGAVPEHARMDLPEDEYAFNRLFVGPGPVVAPLYASAYLEPEPSLMGQATLDVRAFYASCGLSRPAEQAIPDDHLSFELDFLLCLDDALARGGDPALNEVRRLFIEEHMSEWIPAFLGRVLASNHTPPSIAAVAAALGQCLEVEAAPRSLDGNRNIQGERHV